jgi:hypothetical protein
MGPYPRPKSKRGPKAPHREHCSPPPAGFSNRLLRLRDHEIDSGLHFIVLQRRATTARRHHALLTREALDGVLVQHVVTLRDARSPLVLVARDRGTRHTGGMAQRADLLVNALASGVGRGGGRRSRRPAAGAATGAAATGAAGAAAAGAAGAALAAVPLSEPPQAASRTDAAAAIRKGNLVMDILRFVMVRRVSCSANASHTS